MLVFFCFSTEWNSGQRRLVPVREYEDCGTSDFSLAGSANVSVYTLASGSLV